MKSLEYIYHLLTTPLFELNSTPVNIVDFAKVIVIFTLGYYAGKIYRNRVNRLNFYVNSKAKVLIANIGYYIILFVTLIFGLNSVGIDFSSLALFASALSVGMGFGLQTIVSNFISGIILMFERSISVGDFIELETGLNGRVLNINMRSTTIITNDGVEIIVPNSTFIQNNVVNWTLSDDIRRFHIPFGVAYGTEVQKVKNAILPKLNDHPQVIATKGKEPDVWMTQMNNSSVDFELIVWVAGNYVRVPDRTKSDFLILIYNALYENGITIPFPQMDLYIKEHKARKE